MRLPQGPVYKHGCYKEGKSKCVSSIAKNTAAAEEITVKSPFIFSYGAELNNDFKKRENTVFITFKNKHSKSSVSFRMVFCLPTSVIA